MPPTLGSASSLTILDSINHASNVKKNQKDAPNEPINTVGTSSYARVRRIQTANPVQNPK